MCYVHAVLHQTDYDMWQYIAWYRTTRLTSNQWQSRLYSAPLKSQSYGTLEIRLLLLLLLLAGI